MEYEVEIMNPLHPKDKELFDEHPDKIMESIMLHHPSCVNGTLPHYGPLLNFLIKASTGINALEIGVAQGYSSYFIAQAIQYNNQRFNMNGKFIGIDIGDKHDLFKSMQDDGLPVQFIQGDSVEVLPTLKDIKFDFIFQDGYHNTEHCLKELRLFYPMLKGNGDGYLVIHDVYAQCEEYFKEIIDNNKDNYSYCSSTFDFNKYREWHFEYVRFLNNYGLAICRKMEGYDFTKEFWPDGDCKTPGIM